VEVAMTAGAAEAVVMAAALAASAAVAPAVGERTSKAASFIVKRAGRLNFTNQSRSPLPISSALQTRIKSERGRI
jgi:hypothetical protein